MSDEYGPKVDVWAIGCLFSEMASGRPLFPGKTSADQLWLTLRTLGPLPPRQAALMAQDPAYAAVVMPGACGGWGGWIPCFSSTKMVLGTLVCRLARLRTLSSELCMAAWAAHQQSSIGAHAAMQAS